MNPEQRVRSEYFELTNQIAEVLYSSEFSKHSTFPTCILSMPVVNNNIWNEYKDLQNPLAQAIENEISLADTLKARDYQVNLKRTPLGVFAELIKSSFTNWPRAEIDSTSDSNVLVFTHVGDKTSVVGKHTNSRFWGDLASHLKPGHEVRWAHFGKHSYSLRGRGRAMARFLRQLPWRIRYWNHQKWQLHENPLWHWLRHDYRRSILGFPALLSIYTLDNISSILEYAKPRNLLSPYENQYWERALSLASKNRGINHIGWMHTTARFWELRILRPKKLEAFFPTKIVSIGSVHDDLLRASGYLQSEIVKGPALRFSHLSKMRNKSDNEERVLLVTGYEMSEASFMVKTFGTVIKTLGYDFAHRPHPLTIESYKKRFLDAELDDSPPHKLFERYSIFVVDSMSSLALEALYFGCKVLVHKPAQGLNFSPLHSTKEFNCFFSTPEELHVLLGNSCDGLQSFPLRIGNERRLTIEAFRKAIE